MHCYVCNLLVGNYIVGIENIIAIIILNYHHYYYWSLFKTHHT
eukprot:UN03548